MMKPYQTLLKESTQEREKKRNKGQAPKSKQTNSPKEAGHQEEKGTIKNQTLLQLHEAYYIY